LYCGEGSLVNYGVDRVRAITLFCRSWGCETCAPHRKRQVINEAAAGLPTTLITFTTRRGAPEDADAEAIRQGKAFAAFILWLRRSHPKHEIEYFAVREATRRGWPHIHAVLRMPYVHWKKLRRQWLKLSGSPGLDVRAIHNPARCSRYVAKYIGKSTHQFGTAKRYWKSKGWLLASDGPPPRSRLWEAKWWVVSVTVPDLHERYWLRRWDCFKHGRVHYFEAHAPPGGGRHVTLH